MSNIDDEIIFDAAEDARTIGFIRTHIPQELQEKLSEETLYYLLDLLVEYYAESNILEAEPDEEGYVTIDVDAIAAHVGKTARKEGYPDLTDEDIAFVVEAHLESEESRENGEE